jgi:hypothetical protein
MPTGEEIGVVARTIYTVVVVNGITENVPEASYVLDLIASMNVVAVEVASEVDFGGTRSNGSSRRRLEVRVSLPTFIDRVVDAGGFTDTPEFVDGVFELGGMCCSLGFGSIRSHCSEMLSLPTQSLIFHCVACPSDLANPDNDKCEQVTASVGLFLDDEAPQAARQLYQTALDRAIVEGRLQDALMEINPDSPVRIITGKSPGTNGVTSRYTVGIVIGAVAVLGLMVAILIVRKRKRKRAFDELQPVSSIPFGKEFEPDSTGTEELDSAERQRTDEEAGTVQSGNATLGATKAYYGQPSSDDGMQSYIGGRSRESSTASAGMSSINSDSASSNEVEASTFGTKMPDPDTAIVAEDEDARGATADYQSSFSSIQSSIQTGDSSLKVRMDEQKAAELYRLIEGGDWEGILMHADSKLSKNDKSLDVSISSHQQDSQGSASGAVAADEPKAAELHRLINRGDWEGVIRAASTFSSDGKSLGGSLSHPGSRGFASVAESSPPSIASSSVEGLASGSAIGSGITPHTFQSSTLSTGTSKNRDRAELSRQVEELFQLYTLVEGKIEGTKRRASTFSRDEKALDGSILSHLGSPGSASGAVLMDAPKASKLHRLIQAGDWEGVRRAATTLSLSSDDKSLDGSILSHQDSQGSASNADLVDEPKASELHRLIDGGDWEGVIRAASTLSNHDKSLDVSILSHHQDSQGSASNAVLVDEPKASELHRLIQARDWEGVRRAASTFSSDDKSLDGSLSDPGSGGFSFGAESSHLSIASSSVEGSASGSTTGWGITPHTFQSSTLSTGTSKNRDRAELSRQVEELFQLYTLVDGRVTEGAIRAASTFSRDDKSLDGSILSHLGSPGSASGAVLVDEPQAAELHRLIQVGDWEGVRRAATTFSSDGKSLDGSILSHQDSQGSASNAVLVDEPKASELDRLIQVRDWEGVRRAATAFSSDDKSLDGSLLSRLGSPRSASGAESSHRSIASASIEGSASRSTTGPGTTPHTFTSSTPSTGTSTNRDRAGLRRNVEELIHRMAPEETEHVDETMLQFKGREDELLETLRTMQERLIAHKARATSNKQVKLETKK